MNHHTAPQPTGQRVAVVGGGWAGLAAAVRAASEGHHVTVFEASRHWGGRARNVSATLPDGRDIELDNGQHILIGAYTDTLQLMQTVGVDTGAALLRVPLTLVYPDGTGLRLPALGPTDAESTPAPRLTARLSAALALPVLAGVWQARGWAWRDKLALLVVAARWQLSGFRCAAHTTVAELCTSLPAKLVDGFIDPLCISALNTPAARASGQVFLRVLKDALFGLPGGADLLLPKVGLSQLFPQAALAWLTAAERGAHMRLGTRVTHLQAYPPPTQQAPSDVPPQSAQSAHGVVGEPGTWGWLVNGERFDRVVLSNSSSKHASSLIYNSLVATYLPLSEAEEWHPSQRGLAQTNGAAEWVEATQALAFEAIATVYAWCPPPNLPNTGHLLPQPMTALRTNPNEPAQFVFDRSWLDGPKGLLAFVVSASQADAQTLQHQVCAQALVQLGLVVQPIKTIVEKRATFACTPGLQRPKAHIATNLVAAGDHIEGPYPATLEGAVRSGWYAGGYAGERASTPASNVVNMAGRPSR